MTSKRFWIQTFGCQMNEHDSERLAGLFSEQGMEPVGSAEEADLVVFNTCCVRENADNKFYGHLGDLKALKRQRPDLQIAVGGCLAQKDRELIQQRAGHVDVVFGTHNLAHAVDLLERARLEGPIMEILEEAESFPSALPARRDVDHAAWVTIQIGCDNTCAFCIVPAVRGKEQSRRLGDIVREVEELAADGVTEVTLLGQNVNSYGRDLGAGQYRPKFADLLRAVDAVPGIRRIRFTSPPSEGPSTRDDRGHGRVRIGLRAPAPAAPVGQRPDAGPHAPGLHGRAVPGAAPGRPGRHSRTGRDDRHHRWFPR
jgi:tRNA-2-methylthio-N6-dimethylallyladenosine synthase